MLCNSNIMTLISHCTPPARCLFLLLRLPHSCFVFVYFQTCGSYKKRKQKQVLWLVAGNEEVDIKIINRQVRLLNRMIIVHSQQDDSETMI